MSKPHVLQLTGSPQDKFHEQLSLTYARDCAAVLERHVAGFLFLHASPNGEHYLLPSLDDDVLESAVPVSIPEALEAIMLTRPDVTLPQMFCRRGMTTYRAALDLIDIPFIGNSAEVMSLSFDKIKTRAIVSSAGVKVPDAIIVTAGEYPELANTVTNYPAVVKPSCSDNSIGVTLVHEQDELPFAVANAFEHSKRILIEQYISAGREVRCGVIERDGELICLPLQEYHVDENNPIRLAGDKLVATSDGMVELTSRLMQTSWQVNQDDPINEVVAELSRRSHRALGCRQYSLFDFRIDNSGQPWFLEAGLYCSFASSSIISKMASYAGIDLGELFTGFAKQPDEQIIGSV